MERPVFSDETRRVCPSCLSVLATDDVICGTCGAAVAAAARPAGTLQHVETCRIEHWRGYLKSTFFAVRDTGEVVEESRAFRWRKAAPPPATGSPRTAHDELVAALVADGWQPVEAPSRDWFGTRLVRTSVATSPAAGPVAATVRPPAAVPALDVPAIPPAPAALADDSRGAVAREPSPHESPADTRAPESRPAPSVRRRRFTRIRVLGVAGVVALLAITATIALGGRPSAGGTASTPPVSPKPPVVKLRETKQAVPTAHTVAAPSSTATAAKGATAARPLVDLRIAARDSGSWIEIRRGSRSGKVLYDDTLLGGRRLHFRAHRLWVQFGAAGHLSIVVDGTPVKVVGTLAKLFTPPAGRP